MYFSGFGSECSEWEICLDHQLHTHTHTHTEREKENEPRKKTYDSFDTRVSD